MEKLTVTDVGIKAKSKLEVYRILTTEGGVYLPPAKECNYQYIRDIVTGNKLYIKGKDVLCITVPCFKGLSIREICEWAESKCKISKYLPEIKGEIKFPNRSWICNVVNTLKNQEFVNFIKCAYTNREEVLISRKSLKVDALPEFAKLFKSSQSVSHEGGRFHYLLRKSNKRNYRMIEDDEKNLLKQKFEESKEEQYRLNEEILRLNKLIDDYMEERLESDENGTKLHKLFEAGIIDEDGNPVDR